MCWCHTAACGTVNHCAPIGVPQHLTVCLDGKLAVWKWPLLLSPFAHGVGWFILKLLSVPSHTTQTQRAAVAPSWHRAAGAAGCADGNAKQTQSEALVVQTAAGTIQKGFATPGFAALGLPFAAAQAQLLWSSSG